MCPEWYGIASALYQAFQDMVYARLASFHWFGCCILSDGGKASLGDQMSYKFYFLKLLITSLITPLLASFICAFPVMLLLDTEITLLNLLLGVGLGYISILPFLLFLYLPAIYFLSKRYFNLITFIITAIIISGLAGYINFMGIQEPPEWNPGAPPITVFQVLSFVSIYVCTGVMAACIQYKSLLIWAHRRK